MCLVNAPSGNLYGCGQGSGAAAAAEPNWSPEGTRLALKTATSETSPGDIAVVNPYSGGPQVLTSTGNNAQPAWSPDGTKIVFSKVQTAPGIYVMNSNGTGVTQLATNGGEPDWQPLPRPYVRPAGATPLRVSLVPAFGTCTEASINSRHGDPLSYPSCNPPVPLSSKLTVGVGDGSPALARSIGFARMNVIVGNPGPPEDSDARIRFSLTNVMRTTDLSDYTGELRGRFSLRITDRDPGMTYTAQDFVFPFTVPCSATADTTLGASCAVVTSVDSVIPGAAAEGTRAIWGMGQFRVYDGGPDDDGDTDGDNSLFAVQGVFVP